MNIIHTEQLCKTYGRHRGITDVNLAVEKQDIYGFIGPNGAGKSTTIRTLLGLIAPTSGTAHIFGKDCIRQRYDILSDIGYLPSETTFYQKMKVSEIIRLSADLRKQDYRKEAAKLCERLKLDVTKRIHELSLGNRKKVGIVCAFQHNPALYILDEPTSGLDPLIQQVFFDLLTERQKEGATIFFSSHVLSEIQKYCNKAAIIREGQIIAAGEVHDLLQSSTRNITVFGIHTPPPLAGISHICAKENAVDFTWQGDIKELIAALNGLPVNDMYIAEPDIEEIFRHYYEKEAL